MTHIVRIDFAPDYGVSVDGTVWSFKYGKLRPLKPACSRSSPYPLVVLFIGATRKSYLVNRLVAHVFCKKSDGDTEVNHIDFNPKNNAASNLEWTTSYKNIRYSLEHGRWAEGDRSGRAKLAESDIPKIFQLHSEGNSLRAIAKAYGVASTTILKVIKKTTWGCVSHREIA